MMKKTTSALAIAALLGTGAASAVTFEVNEDTTFTLYGNVQIAYTDVETNVADVGNGDADDIQSRDDVTDNGTTLGVYVEHAFEGGLTGFAKLEEDGFDAADDGSQAQNTDEAYLGVKGDFGSIQFGRDDSLYDKHIDGYWGYGEALSPTKQGGNTEARSLQYFSPEFNGLTFAISAQINGDADEATYLADGSGVDDQTNEVLGDANGDDAGNSLAAAVNYNFGSMTLTAAIDQRKNQFVDTRTGSGLNTAITNTNADHFDDPLMGVAARYDFGSFTLDAGYQWDDRTESEGGDRTIGSLGARTSYGAGDIYGVLQEYDVDGGESSTEVFIGANYNVSDNMYLYAEYLTLDRTDDEGDAVAVGAFYGW